MAQVATAHILPLTVILVACSGTVDYRKEAMSDLVDSDIEGTVEKIEYRIAKIEREIAELKTVKQFLLDEFSCLESRNESTT